VALAHEVGHAAEPLEAFGLLWPDMEGHCSAILEAHAMWYGNHAAFMLGEDVQYYYEGLRFHVPSVTAREHHVPARR
jgi:hypothetical protein